MYFQYSVLTSKISLTSIRNLLYEIGSKSLALNNNNNNNDNDNDNDNNIALMIHTMFLKFIFNQYMFRMKHHPSSVDK